MAPTCLIQKPCNLLVPGWCRLLLSLPVFAACFRYNQVPTGIRDSILVQWARMNNVAIIHLVRQNVIRNLISKSLLSRDQANHQVRTNNNILLPRETCCSHIATNVCTLHQPTACTRFDFHGYTLQGNAHVRDSDPQLAPENQGFRSEENNDSTPIYNNGLKIKSVNGLILWLGYWYLLMIENSQFFVHGCVGQNSTVSGVLNRRNKCVCLFLAAFHLFTALLVVHRLPHPFNKTNGNEAELERLVRRIFFNLKDIGNWRKLLLE